MITFSFSSNMARRDLGLASRGSDSPGILELLPQAIVELGNKVDVTISIKPAQPHLQLHLQPGTIC